MKERYKLSLVLNAHLPFIRHPENPNLLEEHGLFHLITDTYLPLLRVFERLDADHIPFRVSMAFSPTLCQMLRDEYLINRYLEHLDACIDFGSRELERTVGSKEQHTLAAQYYDAAVEDRLLFSERYERDLLKAFDYYHKKGRVELLTSAATYAFLPFYMSYPEAIQAQIETAIASHRGYFGRNPQGFWIPELGWYPGLDEYLRSYNFNYTIVDAPGFIHAQPVPAKGSFAPIITSAGLTIFGRDWPSAKDLLDTHSGYPWDPVYRDNNRDIGYDLPTEMINSFLDCNGARMPTGYKYWAVSEHGRKKAPYSYERAMEKVREHAANFLRNRMNLFMKAEAITGEKGHSICVYNTELFGHKWYEGPQFLEALFREAAGYSSMVFINPAEYLNKSDVSKLQTTTPEFSSWGANGFAENWLDSTNDWIYRHVLRSISRMIELSERFPDDGGLKERALNQAAREVLLAQSSDWASFMHQGQHAEYARRQLEENIGNFNSIYEALGSNYISTEWLTNLERRHNLFPEINYRVFRRRK